MNLKNNIDELKSEQILQHNKIVEGILFLLKRKKKKYFFF